METLFERVNAGGTRLEGEELIFSILKSTWREAHELVQRLSKRIMQPSRLVVLTARVVLARLQRDEDHGPPGTPDVRDFRQWMLKNDFLKTLTEEFFEKGRMKQLLEKAVGCLRLQEDESDFGLPPTLVTTLAQSSPDLFLLLLVWLDRHMDTEGRLEISTEERKLLLAALTTLHWFANDQTKCLKECLKVLWKNVGARQYWRQEMLDEVIVAPESNLLIALPLPPDILVQSIQGIFPGSGGWAEWPSENWKGKIKFSSFHDSVPEPAKDWYLNTRRISQDDNNRDIRMGLRGSQWVFFCAPR